MSKCKKCNGYIINFSNKPDGDYCGDCVELLTKDDQVKYNKYVRCPKCRNIFDPGNSEMPSLFEEGDHEIYCDKCDHEYVVSTYIEFSFTSPAMISEQRSNDGEDSNE